MAKKKVEPRWYVVTYTEMSHIYKQPVKAMSSADAKSQVIGGRKRGKGYVRKVSVHLMR